MRWTQIIHWANSLVHRGSKQDKEKSDSNTNTEWKTKATTEINTDSKEPKCPDSKNQDIIGDDSNTYHIKIELDPTTDYRTNNETEIKHSKIDCTGTGKCDQQRNKEQHSIQKNVCGHAQNGTPQLSNHHRPEAIAINNAQTKNPNPIRNTIFYCGDQINNRGSDKPDRNLEFNKVDQNRYKSDYQKPEKVVDCRQNGNSNYSTNVTTEEKRLKCDTVKPSEWNWKCNYKIRNHHHHTTDKSDDDDVIDKLLTKTRIQDQEDEWWLEDKWKVLFDKFDPEGFGEIPWKDFLHSLDSQDFRKIVEPGKLTLLRYLSQSYSQKSSAMTLQLFISIVSFWKFN